MNDDQFTKLYQYIQGEFSKVHTELATKASRDQVDSVYALLDKIIKQHETDEQERLVTNHQLDRHETWIKQLAQSSQTRLAPES